jgi:aminopeptidase YwaD
MPMSSTAARVVVLLLTCAGAGCAARAGDGTAPSPSVAPAAPDLDATGLQRRIDAHLRFLASDALQGRGSGTRDEWIAATYIGAQLAALGLEPMGDDGWFVQPIEVQRLKAASPPALVAGGERYVRGEGFLVSSIGAARVGGGLHHHKDGVAVPAGATVILAADAPPTAIGAVMAAPLVLRRIPAAQASNWAQMAKQQPERVASQLVNVPESPGAPANPTIVTLSAAAFDAVTALADGTPVRLETEFAPLERTRTWNVAGRLPGSDASAASQTIVVSAHLDHIGVSTGRGDASDAINNGADDDASGVAAVVELARLLAQGPRLRRPIVFALFGSEEAGGFGARYFVERPVVPLTDILADLQIEMIGRPDPKVPAGTLWLTGYERSTLGPQLAAHGARLVQDPHPDQRFFERSDNIRFARRGVVAHTVSSFGLHREYHQPSDEVRHINLAHMREAIASLVAPIRWLATTTERPDWLPGQKP